MCAAQMPVNSGASFSSIVDVVAQQQISWQDGGLGSKPLVHEILPSLRADASAARAALVEQLAELDDQVMQAFLDERSLSCEELKAAIRRYLEL